MRVVPLMKKGIYGLSWIHGYTSVKFEISPNVLRHVSHLKTVATLERFPYSSLDPASHVSLVHLALSLHRNARTHKNAYLLGRGRSERSPSVSSALCQIAK